MARKVRQEDATRWIIHGEWKLPQDAAYSTYIYAPKRAPRSEIIGCGLVVLKETVHLPNM